MDSINRIAILAPAKVNLYLDITGVNHRGYHLLNTVMQSVDLCDLLVISCCESSEIRLSCSCPDIPADASNLAYRAASALAEFAGGLPNGVHIHMNKRIPSQAGLGGGSADAAGVLVGLNRMWKLGLSARQLCEIGLPLGADVPFAVRGGCVQAQGIGEQFTPLSPLPSCYLVIAKPSDRVSTAEAYATYDSCPAPIPRQSLQQFLQPQRKWSSLGRELFNVFQQACDLPGCRVIREAMLNHGAAGAVLSGSGSAVVGVWEGEESAKSCAEALSGIADQVFLSRPVDHGPKIIYQD